MNPFARLQNDTVYIEKDDGLRSDPYKTVIGSKKGLSAIIFEAELDVEEGWKLIRPLPNGKEESYTILEANYSPGLHSIQPHWKLKLKKDTSMLNKPSAPKSTTININNSEGIQIGDHNIQHIEKSIAGLIEKIDSSDASETAKAEAKGTLKQLMLNPTVAGILGGATSGLLALLG